MFYLKRNLPVWERLLRLVISVFVGLWAVYSLSSGILQILLVVSAVMFACTALFGFCPACAMMERKAIGHKNDSEP